VNETLEGRAGYLKAFTIAVGVLDATPQIDAAHLFEDIGLRSSLRASARKLLSMGSSYREVFLTVRAIAARSRKYGSLPRGHIIQLD
jgi:hypothetical protein